MAKKASESSDAGTHIFLAQYEIARRNGDNTAMTAIKAAATSAGYTIF